MALHFNYKVLYTNNGDRWYALCSDKPITKILYVSPLAHTGGHRPTRLLSETRVLNSAGFNIGLLTFKDFPIDGKEFDLEKNTVVSQKKFVFLTYFIKALEIKALEKNNLPKVFAYFLEQFSTVFSAILLKKKLNYDIIHLSDGCPSIFILLFLNFFLKGYKWIAHMWSDPRLWGRFYYSPFWQSVYKRSLVRNQFIFLCENDTSKKEYEAVMNGLLRNSLVYLPLATEMVGNTIPKHEARKRLKVPINEKLFLFFGAMHPQKDPLTVAYAAREIKNIKIIFAGKAPIDKINKLKSISENLIFRNHYISEQEKQYYYAAADSVLVSYNKAFSDRGIGMSLWDACRYTKPVIAIREGTIGSLVESFNIGLTYEPEDISSAKKAIINFNELSQKDLKVLEENCRKFCDTFSTKEWIEKYKTILNTSFKANIKV